MSRILSSLMILTLSIFVFCILAQAQTQAPASCDFTLLPSTVNVPNVGRTTWTPSGINDFGTVVGSTPAATVGYGIIRWSGGGVTAVPATSLVARNDNGFTIGYSVVEGNQPIEFMGAANQGVYLLQLNNSTFNNVTDFAVSGVNDWGSIVGWAPRYTSNAPAQGFRLWSNQGVITLDYPGAADTLAKAINDTGAIVGSYNPPNTTALKGFIFYKGGWATLTYPHATSTALTGISNAGAIIGNAEANGSSVAFEYKNGRFKTVTVPNAKPGSVNLLSISLRSGIILGTAAFSSGNQGFVATCQ